MQMSECDGVLFEVWAFVVGSHCILCFHITARDLLDISEGNLSELFIFADPQAMF